LAAASCRAFWAATFSADLSSCANVEIGSRINRAAKLRWIGRRYDGKKKTEIAGAQERINKIFSWKFLLLMSANRQERFRDLRNLKTPQISMENSGILAEYLYAAQRSKQVAFA